MNEGIRRIPGRKHHAQYSQAYRGCPGRRRASRASRHQLSRISRGQHHGAAGQHAAQRRLLDPAVHGGDELSRDRAAHDFVGEDIVMPSEGSTLRQALNSIFSRLSMRPPSTLSTDSFEFMANLVVHKFGIGFQLRLTPGPDPIRSELVYVPIRDQDIPSTTLACCISEEGTPSAAVSVCLQALRNALERWFRDGSC